MGSRTWDHHVGQQWAARPVDPALAARAGADRRRPAVAEACDRDVPAVNDVPALHAESRGIRDRTLWGPGSGSRHLRLRANVAGSVIVHPDGLRQMGAESHHLVHPAALAGAARGVGVGAGALEDLVLVPHAVAVAVDVDPDQVGAVDAVP